MVARVKPRLRNPRHARQACSVKRKQTALVGERKERPVFIPRAGSVYGGTNHCLQLRGVYRLDRLTINFQIASGGITVCKEVVDPRSCSSFKKLLKL